MRKALFLVLFLLYGAARAQDSAFLSDELFRLLNNELSGDIAFDHVRHLTRYHAPNGGSRDFMAEAEWIAAKAREYGLEDVRVVTQKYRSPSWTPLSGELWMVEPEEIKLGSFAEAAVSIADYSRSADVTAELVDVGAGDSPDDYRDKNVEGKIVLAHGRLSRVMEEAVWKRKALGIVAYSTARLLEHPDQIAWGRLQPEKPDGQKNTFAFNISARTALWLKDRLARRPERDPFVGIRGEGEVKERERIKVRVVIEAEFREPSTQAFVEAYIRGSKYQDEDIVLTAHMQEEKFSANDDRSGCANLLEIGRALAKLIKEGKLRRPLRDIRFWWVNEFSSEYQYFSDFPDERGRMLVNINQDMVGAKQSVDSRSQHITRTPWSRPSFLNDVVENIAAMVIDGNNSFLAARQAGSPQPFSRPVLSRLGTREPFAARIVPYFDSTDHHVFNDAMIGVPGVTLTNWPDELIHSTDDDLWAIDPTQLKRNAFIVTAAALYIAGADADEAPGLASVVYAGAKRRIGEDFATAVRLLKQSARADIISAYKQAANLVRQAIAREARAVESVAVFAKQGSGEKLTAELAARLRGSEKEYRDDLARFYRAFAGQDPPASFPLTEKEKQLGMMVAERIGTVADYVENREKVKRVRGLHPLMSFEILNFVNGENSALDVYNAVSAEAIAAGDWYYGKVTLEQVEEYLKNAAEAKLLKIERAAKNRSQNIEQEQ